MIVVEFLITENSALSCHQPLLILYILPSPHARARLDKVGILFWSITNSDLTATEFLITENSKL